MGVSLACMGDVMLARGVSEVLATVPPEHVWGDLLPLLGSADLRLANLECCISDRGRPFWPPRVFSFRAIPKAVDCLRAARIDVVTLANNHSLDYEAEALVDTLERLEAAGIAHVGAGRDLEEAMRPAVLRAADGTQLGFVGFTDNFPEYAAGPGRPGTFHVEIRPEGVEVVAAAVRRARELGADVVVVTAHWGPNMRLRPPPAFRAFARAVMEAGADLWFGHSAHVFQGVELVDGKPVVYDGGDFVDDYAVHPELRNDRSLLWMARFEGGAVELSAYPVRLRFAQTTLARGEDLEWIAARLTELSGEFGTTVRRQGGRLVLERSRDRVA